MRAALISISRGALVSNGNFAEAWDYTKKVLIADALLLGVYLLGNIWPDFFVFGVGISIIIGIPLLLFNVGIPLLFLLAVLGFIGQKTSREKGIVSEPVKATGKVKSNEAQDD